MTPLQKYRQENKLKEIHAYKKIKAQRYQEIDLNERGGHGTYIIEFFLNGRWELCGRETSIAGARKRTHAGCRIYDNVTGDLYC